MSFTRFLDDLTGRRRRDDDNAPGLPHLSGVWAIRTGIDSSQTALGATKIAAGTFTDFATNKLRVLIPPPNLMPRRSVRILQMYLPVLVQANPSPAPAPPPTKADVSIGWAIHGATQWLWQQTIDLALADEGIPVYEGRLVATVDFVNPPVIPPGDQAALAYMVSFDQAIGIPGQTTYWILVAPTTNTPDPGKLAQAAIHWETAD